MPTDDTSASLSVQRSRSRRWLVVLVCLVAVVAGGAWYSTHPSALPTPPGPVEATTPAGSPIYVGIYTPDPDGGRTLTVRDLDVDPLSDTVPVSVIGLVCKDGSVGVTTDPSAFCGDLVRAEGESVGPGDVLVVQVYGETPGMVELDRVRLTFREGLRWGSAEVGPPIVATFLST